MPDKLGGVNRYPRLAQDVKHTATPELRVVLREGNIIFLWAATLYAGKRIIMLNKSIISILAILKGIVLRYISEDSWGWDGDQPIAWGIFPLFNITDDEVSGFATTSCAPTLWAFRALANRLGVSVPQADWFWHNHRKQVEDFVYSMIADTQYYGTKEEPCLSSILMSFALHKDGTVRHGSLYGVSPSYNENAPWTGYINWDHGQTETAAECALRYSREIASKIAG